MKLLSINLKMILIAILAGMAFWLISPTILPAQSSSVSYYTISDIGDPKPWKPGQVQVGENIDVVITARDANGDVASGFNGQVFLSEKTDYGEGRIDPEIIQLTNGEWRGTVKIFRAGRKKSDFMVVGDVWIQVTDNAANPHFGTSNIFTAITKPFSRLLIILPGETHFPGSLTGLSGLPLNQEPGSEFTIEIFATDAYWNQVKASDTIHLISSDPDAVLPSNRDLVDGETIMNVTLNTSGSQTITVFDVDDQVNIMPHTSSTITVVGDPPIEAASFRFDTIGSPQTAGDTLQVTITAVDGSGQTVATYTGQANLTVSTGPGTIQVGNVIFANGSWSGPIVLTKAEQNVHLDVHDFSNISGESNPFNIVAGDLTRLQILLPGENATPGLAPGKSGLSAKQLAGKNFQIEVRATDAWWNLVNPGDLDLEFSSSDPQASLPQNPIQNTAQANYDVSFLKEGQNLISVRAVDHPVLTESYTSSQFFVDSGLIDRFVVSDIDSIQTAGQPFQVKIDAVDSDGNPVANYNKDILLFASTGNGTISRNGVTLANGSWEGELFVTRADSDVVIYAADYAPPPSTHSGSSNMFVVIPDTVAGLQVLLPGQSSTPGVDPGYSGSPDLQIAGDAIKAVVRAVDSFWNLIPDYSDFLSLSASDSFAVVADSVTLENGEMEIDVTFRAAGAQQLIVSSLQTDLTMTSEDVTVLANVFTQLLLVLPGQTVLPGDDETDANNFPGRSGSAVPQTSGLPFTVDVYAVDDYFNPITDVPADQVQLFVTDSQAAISPTDTVLVDGHAQFSVTVTQGGSQVLRANDVSNSAIRQSLEGVVDVLVGGLHYEVTFDANEVTAGQPFTMHVFFKNGIGENVVSANHLVHLSAVAAGNLNQEVGTLENSSFNLQAGQRTVSQAIDKAGLIRIKVTDDASTEPGYSEPLRVTAGDVASLNIAAAKQEVGGAEETDIKVTLKDAAGNLIPGQEVHFAILSGSGSLKQDSAVSDSTGIAKVVFKAGKITETNRIRASVDSLATDIEIVVNLTQSDLPDGVVVNYPNPFGLESPATSIDYYLPEDADVTLKIFDLFGNLVWTAEFEAGTPGARARTRSVHPNSVQWTGINDKGQKVANGGYILLAKAVADGKVVMETKRKIVVLR